VKFSSSRSKEVDWFKLKRKDFYCFVIFAIINEKLNKEYRPICVNRSAQRRESSHCNLILGARRSGGRIALRDMTVSRAPSQYRAGPCHLPESGVKMIAHHFLATKRTGHFSAQYCDISHATIMSWRAIRPSPRRAPSIELQWDDFRRRALLFTQIGRYSLFNFSLIIAHNTKQYKSFLLNLRQSTSLLRVG